MPPLGKLTGPGYLCIYSQPKTGRADEYNDWHDTESGPLRLKLGFSLNGFRYRSTEDASLYLSTYDMKRLSGLSDSAYSTIDQSTSRIRHRLNHLDQRVYTPLTTRGHVSSPAPVMMSVAFVVKDEHVDELHRWYEEEHTGDLQKIPGWQRSRRFELVHSADQKPGHTELLAVHEFASENGLDGPEHKLAKAKPWRNRVLGLVSNRTNSRYELVHEVKAGDYKPPDSAVGVDDGASTLNGIPKTFTSSTPLLAN